MNSNHKPVAVVVGATSKWQADGRNTKLAHGRELDDSNLPIGIRWGVGGAIAQKFAHEGFFIVLTTRNAPNASALEAAIREQGGDTMIVELDLVSQDSISEAFAQIREQAGDPEVLVYNAGYLEGRDLPPEKELLEHIPVEMFDRSAYRQPWTVPGRQGGIACYAGARPRVFPHLQQLLVLTRTKAIYGTVAVLSKGDDARAGAGADRGVFRIRSARSQCRNRRYH
jgi:NAD(P)-dependent dehydrogenase (short-subunit alcohol dehydrogenase family)